MKHYLNVCNVHGDEIAPVDIITFGSPCQDLSVAGKRAGLDGARSGLFTEAVRIIKEMRKKTNGRCPAFAIWENVPGAFSSQDGEDFRTVLEELAKIKESDTTIPRPPKGKWTDAGAIMGDGWSIAWRVLDAQFHGVPQRRRRILLVTDFTGGRAGEILFKCSGLPGYPSESDASGQEIAPDASVCVGTDDSAREKCLMPDAEGLDAYNLILTGDIAATLGINCGTSTGRNGVCRQISCDAFLEEWGVCIPINDKATRYRGGGESRNGDGCGNGLGIGKPGDPSPTLTVGDHHAVCCAAFSAGQGAKAGGIGWQEEVSPTLKGVMSGSNTVPAICIGANQNQAGRDDAKENQTHALVEPPMCYAFHLTQDPISSDDVSPCLSAGNPKNGQATVGICAAFSAGQGAKAGGIGWQEEVAPTLKSTLSGGNTIPTICIQGSMIGRAEQNGPQGDGINENVSFTLNTIDRHAVCLLDDQGGSVISATEHATVAPTIRAQMHGNIPAVCLDSKDIAEQGANPEPMQKAYTRQALGKYADKDIASSIKQRDYKEATDLIVEKGSSRFIVRRLTPTECDRLQGFPDWWGELPTITDMDDEEYDFWCEALFELAKIEQTAQLDVSSGTYTIWREIKPDKKKHESFKPYWMNTGKPYKAKTRPQMVAWYNKLHTDGAEYKMWGNGVALPVVRVPLHEMAKLGTRTLGSLFDGSGGFPLAGVLEGITPLWASEIEPYPIAVTRERFKEC